MNASLDPVHSIPFLDLPFLQRDVAMEERADGALLTCEPADVLPMAQRYFLF